MSNATTYSVYVWGEHTSRSGLRAWPDLNDDSECMDDYTLYEGSAGDLREVAAEMKQQANGSPYNSRVADLLLSEIGE